jgi:hypothetical protein
VRRSKEIVALLLLFVALASVVLWTVASRKAAQRDAPSGQRTPGPVAPDLPRNP